MKVILVTGSRTDSEELRSSVYAALTESQPDFLILGDCPTGADSYALHWAKGNGVNYSIHYADKNLWPAAGPLRNQQMVNEGKQLLAEVFAFPCGESRGTRDCMRKARKAGLKVTEL